MGCIETATGAVYSGPEEPVPHPLLGGVTPGIEGTQPRPWVYLWGYHWIAFEPLYTFTMLGARWGVRFDGHVHTAIEQTTGFTVTGCWSAAYMVHAGMRGYFRQHHWTSKVLAAHLDAERQRQQAAADWATPRSR